MEIIAKTFSGLEDVLKKEIEQIGGQNIKILKRSVSFEGDKKLLYTANYKLRTALKILTPIFDFEFKDINDFYAQLYDIEWEKYFDVKNTISIDPVIFSDFFDNTHFAALKAKDAIVDSFMSKVNRRPSVDIKNADVKINLYISDKYVNVSLDSSGMPLFKRGWRMKQGVAPLNEVLAAGIILLSEWDKKTEFLDYMCGSATLPIEATMIGLNIPPQIRRKKFGFQKWKDYDSDLWEKVVEEENNKQSMNLINIFASDNSARTVDEAQENISFAGFSPYISLQKRSFENVSFNSDKHIVFNPPYGKRIGKTGGEMNNFYKTIGDSLKRNFIGSDAWIFTGNLDAIKHVGLRSSKKIILFNGPIESRLVKYELY